MITAASGIDVVHVPYKGGGEAKTALMTGESAFTITNVQLVLPQIQAGKLRALATTGARRVAVLPDVPTLAEEGIKGVEITTWFGLFAPNKKKTGKYLYVESRGSFFLDFLLDATFLYFL